jgi:hypothetical protein
MLPLAKLADSHNFAPSRSQAPPNRAFWCQYAVQFVAVLRGYGLPVDAPSAPVLREAAETCPNA